MRFDFPTSLSYVVMMQKNIILSAILFAPMSLQSCDSKPDHYLVQCDQKDGMGWELTDVEKNDDGYILACTYTSPDKSNSYTRRCTSDGCN